MNVPLFDNPPTPVEVPVVVPSVVGTPEPVDVDPDPVLLPAPDPEMNTLVPLDVREEREFV